MGWIRIRLIYLVLLELQKSLASTYSPDWLSSAWSWCYFDFAQWSHDCNLTLCILLETLIKVAAHQPLAPRLLVQMDNCVRENKNKYVMGFCALLVEAGIFTEVNNVQSVNNYWRVSVVAGKEISTAGNSRILDNELSVYR